MSQGQNPPPLPKAASRDLRYGMTTGIIGIVVGAGASFLGMQFYRPAEKVEYSPSPSEMQMTMPPGGPPPATTDFVAKASLTALVGALESLTRENPDLRLALDQDQSVNIAAELAKLEAAATLTGAEAQSSLQTLAALLTPQQKEIVDAMGVGPVSAAPGENPFTKEKNKKRLEVLLYRLKPTGNESARPSGN